MPTVRRAFDTRVADVGCGRHRGHVRVPDWRGALLVGCRPRRPTPPRSTYRCTGVNHLAGHIAVDTLQHCPLPHAIAGVARLGGHTQLLRVDDIAVQITESAPQWMTRPEAYDKVARVLGPAVSGGPPIDRAAREGDPNAIAFPRRHDRTSDAPVTTLVLRLEDGGGPVGRGRPGSGSGHPGGGCGGVVPGGGRGRVDGRRRCGPRPSWVSARSSSPVGGGESAAGEPGRRNAARTRVSSCVCHDRGCARTTVR